MDWRKGKLAIAKAIDLDLTHQQEHYAQALRRCVRPGDKWLDVGCGHSIVPNWAMPQEDQERLVRSVALLVGIDVDEGAGDSGFEVEELTLVGTTGLLDRLGPAAWIECFLQKGCASLFNGKLQPDVVVVLKRKEPHDHRHIEATAVRLKLEQNQLVSVFDESNIFVDGLKGA